RSTSNADFPPHAKAIAELLGQQLGVYHYLATTIRDLNKTKTELSQNLKTLKELQNRQILIFEDLKHQLYSPINQAHIRLQTLLKTQYPDVHEHLDRGTVS